MKLTILMGQTNQIIIQLIKGGGALTREKIMAVAQKFICIADESKFPDVIGEFPLPIDNTYGKKLYCKKNN